MTNNGITILSIDTSADICTVALSRDGVTFAESRVTTPRSQSSLLVPETERLLRDAGLRISDCNAVAVSMGPGSYTGLRVGVSTAKGLCFGSGAKLIGIGTLDLLAVQGLSATPSADYVVPMMDARRMEVYQAVYGRDGSRISEISPLILDGGSYSELLAKGKVTFVGNGCAKFRELISNGNATFVPCEPEAAAMAPLAYAKWVSGCFEDVAYAEPFYLKEFSVGVSKKNILDV
ncbi:MAG: tRNA (adenosine(37)-N6)-threonylcarbamoyltransferase complex dimerization subunit type 1 TsaB [Bacteroidales bacterium]|nr:tRNA (adenosine(37)-N6)-threonylcarbamoyltransferase complex dimerization subunit type 1 TsaB [Bacteroidales bacterium]